jgi:uncharacterized protein (DUF924 family)
MFRRPSSSPSGSRPEATDDGALTLLIVLDQFPRNISRGYLPLMHSEHLADQQRCVEVFRNADNPKYAEDHADMIHRFGRFRHRNAVLGGITKPEEQAFLDSGGFSG